MDLCYSFNCKNTHLLSQSEFVEGKEIVIFSWLRMKQLEQSRRILYAVFIWCLESIFSCILIAFSDLYATGVHIF
jgi:hypothetical protein